MEKTKLWTLRVVFFFLVALQQCVSAVLENLHTAEVLSENICVCPSIIFKYFLVVSKRVKSPENSTMHTLSGNDFIELHLEDGPKDKCNISITISTLS